MIGIQRFAPAPMPTDNGTVRLGPGIAPSDLALELSADGQTLLLLCGEALVFADGRRVSVEDLLKLMGE